MKLNNFEDMHGDLRNLLDQSRELIKKNRMRFEDAKQIALYVTEMRVMLDTLWEARLKMNPQNPDTDAYTLKEDVRELEGIVKEIRNSLEPGRGDRGSNL